MIRDAANYLLDWRGQRIRCAWCERAYRSASQYRRVEECLEKGGPVYRIECRRRDCWDYPAEAETLLAGREKKG